MALDKVAPLTGGFRDGPGGDVVRADMGDVAGERGKHNRPRRADRIEQGVDDGVRPALHPAHARQRRVHKDTVPRRQADLDQSAQDVRTGHRRHVSLLRFRFRHLLSPGKWSRKPTVPSIMQNVAGIARGIRKGKRVAVAASPLSLR
jgi:hypothetical protein